MRILIVALLWLPALLPAQFSAPAASPPATSSALVGYTELSLDYHRPGVRGREVFGELVPWGKLWRAGANRTTLLRISKPVTVGGKDIDAGTYRLLIIPRRDSAWTWIINDGKSDAWGARDYEAGNDVVRYDAYPRRLSERTETLEFRWMNVRPQAVDLVLEWEWIRLRLPVKLRTDAEVAERAATSLSPAEDPNDYYAIARYYLDQGKIRQAKAWIDRWAANAPEQFGRLRYQAIIEHELGNERRAVRIMQRSLELAREAGNDHYVRMNEKSLREWRRTAIDLPADSVVARSVRYHDPSGVWSTQPHQLQLAESRPDGTVRKTALELFPHTDEFVLVQTRGADDLRMAYRDGNFTRSLNGQPLTDEDRAKSFGMTQKGLLRMRDYYTYLYGLPMKLRDAGTNVEPVAHKVWYDGRELIEVRVTYDPATGKDNWSLYFDPVTYALSGYAFYHASDGPKTGEFILLEDEAEVGPLRLPAKRHWYTTEDRRYLGTDAIIR